MKRNNNKSIFFFHFVFISMVFFLSFCPVFLVFLRILYIFLLLLEKGKKMLVNAVALYGDGLDYDDVR